MRDAAQREIVFQTRDRRKTLLKERNAARSEMNLETRDRSEDAARNETRFDTREMDAIHCSKRERERLLEER
jgi:hypothetical protein